MHILPIVGLLCLFSCSSKVAEERQKLQKEMSDICAIGEHIKVAPTHQDILTLLNKMNSLQITEGLFKKQEYYAIKHRADSIIDIYSSMIQDVVPRVDVMLDCKYDQIMERGSFIVANKIQKGDKLFLDYSSHMPIGVNIHNAETQTLIKSYAASTQLLDSLTIPNTAIYLVEFTNQNKAQYISYEVYVNCQNLENFITDPNVQEKEVPASPEDYLAYYRNEYDLTNLYEKPRQFTLRGGWKSAFGGHKRTILPLNLPQNSVNVAYQLRLDTSNGAASNDGAFYKELNDRCSTIKILGTTVKEKNESHTSLLREVLNEMKTPQRVEEAYCSMYVFYDEKSARDFVSTGKTEQCDIKYSLISTQSCNGNIPVNQHENIYLGFENDQFAGSIYLWIEAVATITQTNYYTKHYF